MNIKYIGFHYLGYRYPPGMKQHPIVLIYLWVTTLAQWMMVPVQTQPAQPVTLLGLPYFQEDVVR